MHLFITVLLIVFGIVFVLPIALALSYLLFQIALVVFAIALVVGAVMSLIDYLSH